MSEAPILRRASYGPSSREIGVRGASTRTRITQVSLELFGELGYFDTSVDAIAKAAGISRATLYQYFAGKDEIYLELLDECGSALLRVARRIGPLGRDEVGFDNLNWWLGEWSWVFEKYSTMFIQWNTIASSDSQARLRIERLVRSYNDRIAERLAGSGVRGIDPETAALVMTVLVHRVNLLVHTGSAYGRSAQDAIDTLSVYLQLLLFPDTPEQILTSLRLYASADPAADLASAEGPGDPEVGAELVDERTAGLSKRAANTVAALSRAGIGQFRAKGYRRTSVDDIIAAAGVARGTFYKYFADKTDLLTAVAGEIHRDAETLAGQIADVDPLADEAALRGWLSAYLEFLDRYSGCIDAWVEKTTDDAFALSIGASTLFALDRGVAQMLVETPSRYPFDPIMSALIVRALVTSIPQMSFNRAGPPTSDWIVELFVVCIQRGFFGVEAEMPSPPATVT